MRFFKHKEIIQYGICKHGEIMPSMTTALMAYPEILPFKDIPEIKGQYVFLIKDYVQDGLSMLIEHVGDEMRVQFGDWDGHVIDATDTKHKYYNVIASLINDKFSDIVALLKMIGVKQLQLYFSLTEGKLMLVDIRRAVNSFCSPGMVKDVFGKLVDTQIIVDKPLFITDEVFNNIKTKQGIFKQPLILKPSAFKTTVRGKDLYPMYARIS